MQLFLMFLRLKLSKSHSHCLTLTSILTISKRCQTISRISSLHRRTRSRKQTLKCDSEPLNFRLASAQRGSRKESRNSLERSLTNLVLMNPVLKRSLMEMLPITEMMESSSLLMPASSGQASNNCVKRWRSFPKYASKTKSLSPRQKSDSTSWRKKSKSLSQSRHSSMRWNRQRNESTII